MQVDSAFMAADKMRKDHANMNADAYLDLLRARYSVRAFTNEQLTEEELTVILEAGRLSPTACNNQPVRICVVQSTEGLAKVDECSKCRYGAPTALIVAFDKNASAKGMGCESGDFGTIDASIVITNMANAAAALGLGSCWVGAYDPQAVRAHFNVPADYELVDMLMLGHPAPECTPSPRHADRFPLTQTVSHEAF